MSARVELLKKLTDSRNTSVERAAEYALLESTGKEQCELADVLMERNRRGGWVALIRSYHKLEKSVREKIMTRPRDLFGPLAETMQDSDGPARENVITIIQSCSDVRLVYLLAEALMDARPEVRTIAGNSLLEAVRRHSAAVKSQALECAVDLTINDQLRRAVEEALRHFKSHRQTAVLQAALICERQQDGTLWALFQDPYDDRTRAATILLRSPTEPAMATAVFLALGSNLKPAAMAGLAAVESFQIAEAVADESYRLIDPLLREPALGVNHLKLLPALRKEPPWNIENWSGWLRLIDMVGLAPMEKLTWLNRMLEAAPAPAVAWKIALARSIADTELPEACIPLTTLVRDADERVARCAVRYILGRRIHEWRDATAKAVAASPHASVRRLAAMVRNARPPEPTSGSRGQTTRGFDKAWNDYQRMPPAIQHTTARTVANDPILAEQLKIKFAGSSAEIAQALKMVAGLADLTPYRKQIVSLCGSKDDRIAAMAVRLIGRLEDPKLKELLEAAARHADSRVRANAVESMEELHVADRSQQVLEMLNSRHNRERANAIRALGQFNFATARECLAHMLTDSNPLHRMSALWVVDQLNLMEVLRQVSSIGRRDPNARVRRRATEMIETLSGSISTHT